MDAATLYLVLTLSNGAANFNGTTTNLGSQNVTLSGTTVTFAAAWSEGRALSSVHGRSHHKGLLGSRFDKHEFRIKRPRWPDVSGPAAF